MSNNERKCPLRSDCRAKADREYVDDLFKDNWEVFVIRHNKNSGKFNWFTECCNRVVNSFVNGNKLASSANC
jgi:hypothetical protein